MTGQLSRVALGLSLTGGALTVFWLLVSLLTRRRFSARWHRSIGLAVLGFYTLPAGLAWSRLWSRLVPSSVGSEGWLNFPPPLDFADVTQTAQAGQAATPVWRELMAMIPIVWLAVAALLLAWRLLGILRFRRVLVKASLPLNRRDAEPNCFACPTCDFPLRVRIAPGVGTPMLVGFLRPILFLPDLDWGEGELTLVLRHELTHHRHGDMWVKLWCLVLRSVHWCNPLVYLLTNWLDRQLELACDEAVVREMDLEGRKAYGTVILNTMDKSSGGRRHVSAALGGHASGIKERLMAIVNLKTITKKAKVLSVAAAALLCATGLVAANVLYIPVEAVAFVDDGPREMRVPPTEEQLIAAEPGTGDEEVIFPSVDDTGEGPDSFLWPVGSGYITSGLDTYPGHTGIDIAGPKGTDVYATADGLVVTAKRQYYAYGIYVIIDHGGGYQSLYGHLDDMYVEVGDTVSQGQVIAARGRSGNCTGYNLHFEIRHNGVIEDPMDYVSE